MSGNILDTYHICTADEMRKLGSDLALLYPKLCLHGILGAGKTTFAQGFCDAITLSPTIVTSPTYTYSQIYGDVLLHIDMYNIHTAQQLIGYGIIDQIDTFSHILIERPKFQTYYIDDTWTQLSIDLQHDGSRVVTIG